LVHAVDAGALEARAPARAGRHRRRRGDMQKAVVRELAKLIWNNVNNPDVA
jgi:hypothetical protein